MGKTIQYPTDAWIDAYVEKHNATIEEAEMVWWDKQIDKGNPTPFDLTPEQEKESRKATRPKAHQIVDPAGKTRIRERKPNEDKRLLIDCLHDTLKEFDSCCVANPEREITFVLNNVHYSVVLTAHRAPKK